MLAVLVPAVALAQRDSTREALARMEADLTVRATERGGLPTRELLPIILVSAEPRFEETRAWFPTQALGAMVRVFGGASVRSCEACMGARLRVEGSRVEQSTVALDGPEIVRFDETVRGTSEPAKTAVWLDETMSGVSLRIIDLRNGRVVLAETYDDTQLDQQSLQRNVKLLKEEERRARGDALAHTFLDATVLTNKPHISLDWAEQFGDTNRNLAGFTVSILDPVVGIGGTYSRIIPEAFNITVGLKVLVSVPQALISAFNTTDMPTQFLDPLLTGVLVVRWPIFNSNFGLVLTLSTNGAVGLGISLLNISLLPVLP